MATYKVEITWLYAVETVVFDTQALQPGDLLTTSETFTEENGSQQYQAEVVALAEDATSIALTLRYEKWRNEGANNDSWGTSVITLKLSPEKLVGGANWTDDSFKTYNGAAQRVLVTRLATEEEQLTEDLADIVRQVQSTERATQILARIGQGRFRADVTRAWKIGEACAVTGITVAELLTASHIRAWSDSDDEQRLDPANGLLLATHVDRLFDRHLLSFEKIGADYRIRFNPRIQQVANELGIKADARLAVENLSEAAGTRFAQYMARHFERFTARLEE